MRNFIIYAAIIFSGHTFKQDHGDWGRAKSLPAPQAVAVEKKFAIETPAYNSSSLDALKRKAESGEADSQYELGILYLYGDGASILSDFSMFEYWLTHAAQGGNYLAQFHLGVGYGLGTGVYGSLKLDPVEGLMWLLIARQHDQDHQARIYSEALIQRLSKEQIRAATIKAQQLGAITIIQ